MGASERVVVSLRVRGGVGGR